MSFTPLGSSSPSGIGSRALALEFNRQSLLIKAYSIHAGTSLALLTFKLGSNASLVRPLARWSKTGRRNSLLKNVCQLEALPERFCKALEYIEDITTNTDEVQQKVLGEILSLNGDVEYLRNFNLGRSIDRDTFKSRVPIVNHEDLQPFIHRIVNGDHSPVLTSHPVTEFLISSGTSSATGDRKLIPMTSHEMDLRQRSSSLTLPIMNLYVQSLDKGKALYSIVTHPETKTPSGLRACSFSTSFYQNKGFINRPYEPYHDLVSPNETILCHDSFQSMYAQMLCGLLMRRQILRIGAGFASTLLNAINFFKLNWQQLTHDIAIGSLNPKITDQSLRDCIAKILLPDPQLAELITRECESGNWEGIIARIWPNTIYLDVIVTGSMAQYIPQLDYYSGSLPKVSTIYVSSEACFGMNLHPMARPEDIVYTIMPNMGYFEFISTDSSSDENAVDLADVEIGKEYEPIVTTHAGLYRYRVGDILRVTGFYNSAPQFKFIRRKNVILSIDTDKTNEVELQTSVDKAASLLQKYNTTVVDYTSTANTSSIPGHYVVYWELGAKDHANNAPGPNVLAQCCLTMEESLSSEYRECRHCDTVGPLEIRIVKGGTFRKLMDYAISKGASIYQYKTPRCVSLSPMINLLDAHVESVHFSPKLPYWVIERCL